MRPSSRSRAALPSFACVLAFTLVLSLSACSGRERATPDAAPPALDTAAPRLEPRDATPSLPREGGTITLAEPVDTTSEARALGSARGVTRRDSLTLVVTLDDGRTVVLADDTSDRGWLRHTYLGRVPGAAFHLVRRSHVEHRDHLLVSARTGRRTVVDAPPVVSPDGARFVTTAMDLTAEFEPTRIEIWRVVGDSAVREWREEPTDWGPTDARWIDAQTVEFVVNTQVGEEPDVVRRTRGRVRSGGEGWVVVVE